MNLAEALDVLELSPKYSQAEVKAAYRRLALKHHPDRGGSLQKMVQVNLAYEAVTQPSKRTAGKGPARTQDRPESEQVVYQGGWRRINIYHGAPQFIDQWGVEVLGIHKEIGTQVLVDVIRRDGKVRRKWIKVIWKGRATYHKDLPLCFIGIPI